MKCESKFDKDVSYNWTVNNVNYNGAFVHYKLKTSERDVTFTCTVSNRVSNKSESMNVNCQSEGKNHKSIVSDLNIKAILVVSGMAFLIIISIIGLVVYCRHKKAQAECNDELTVYAEIDDVTSSKITTPCSLYETVDVKPSPVKPKAQTVYDQIQFNRMQP
ncbi:hypothetical protein WMY93_014628 [Mugilogobius chulae]|uniref:Ig-like domain-containing protein n=1 Tax=Mugilogobius chulae TaxID=88201 RepID=A0AAW0NW15_9GOBI